MASRAIVTGGAGFIGSHLVDRLVADGHAVTVIDDLSSGRRELVNPQAELHELDIVDAEAVRALAVEVQPQTIFHLAAQASVVVSVQDPTRDCAVNVQGTLGVVRAAEDCGASVVYTSTGGALYGDSAPMPTGEDQIPAPLSPYGASKWAGEAYVQTWSLSTGTPHAICRLGNVYGPRQSPHGEAGVVAIFSGHLHDGRSPRLYGHGKPTRDYIFVGDVVDALVTAVGHAGTFNIATEAETDVATVWKRLSEVAGVEIEPELADLRPGELQRSCLAVGRAERDLNWRHSVTLADGLAQTYRALVEELDRG
jgi:UDP-glucose 4-epimerase